MRRSALPARLAALSVAVLLPYEAARGQPADCPAARPASERASLPLMLDLQGLPGAPKGIAGSVGIDIARSGPSCAAPDPPPGSADVQGPPGGVLSGPPARDLLLGTQPQVVIDVN